MMMMRRRSKPSLRANLFGTGSPSRIAAWQETLYICAKSGFTKAFCVPQNSHHDDSLRAGHLLCKMAGFLHKLHVEDLIR